MIRTEETLWMIVLVVPCLTASRDWETMQPVDDEGDFIRSPFEVQ